MVCNERVSLVQRIKSILFFRRGDAATFYRVEPRPKDRRAPEEKLVLLSNARTVEREERGYESAVRNFYRSSRVFPPFFSFLLLFLVEEIAFPSPCLVNRGLINK